MAIFGPTGSGKTYTSLRLARELDPGSILVIDTERESAGLYEEELNHDGRVDTIVLEDCSPHQYMEALRLGAQHGYQTVIIDSLSHAWSGKGGVLEQVDNIAKRSQSNNSFAAWRDGSKMHNELVDAILAYPGNIIATMRVKTEYVVEEVGGKKSPRKVGLAPVQRDGVEYEFDIVGDMDQENSLIVTKTRCATLGGKVFSKPGVDLAQIISEWLSRGKDEVLTDPRKIHTALMLTREQDESLKTACKSAGVGFSEMLVKAWAEGARSCDAVLAKITQPTQPELTPGEQAELWFESVIGCDGATEFKKACKKSKLDATETAIGLRDAGHTDPEYILSVARKETVKPEVPDHQGGAS